ncbi:hypothetical protein [Lentilactobacillus hilgardii]|uniref:hypothetical protein n=1 Tax=Lentilactobacillus hilgardii TaxID=1588 RepID=UPI0021C32879|nr:hypothetical protein [Lentilactobacillus hilgardii]MCP9334290.1 hypothetical protein [Lentilactobacillus hilgardii]MCP9350657.1 hypothetical protein [Lentilactobacillus hilgardii]MCP9353562.1 hypothetical protein [Lentilactobacillus hilgardii]
MDNCQDELFNLLENTPVSGIHYVSLKTIYDHTDLAWKYSFSEIRNAFDELVRLRRVKGQPTKSEIGQDNWAFLGILQ